ncbi:MAG: hypothetical protein ACRD4D_09450 [Candidatus Acidiferrales bacterium]
MLKVKNPALSVTSIRVPSHRLKAVTSNCSAADKGISSEVGLTSGLDKAQQVL